MNDFIYHFVETDYFNQFEGKEDYYPTYFEQEGFIHNCFKEQFEYVLNKHFKAVDEVYVLKIDPKKLKAKLIVEGDQHPLGFPHIYGPINMDAIVSKTIKKLN